MSTISRPQVVNFNESKTKIIGSKDSSYLVIDNFLQLSKKKDSPDTLSENDSIQIVVGANKFDDVNFVRNKIVPVISSAGILINEAISPSYVFNPLREPDGLNLNYPTPLGSDAEVHNNSQKKAGTVTLFGDEIQIVSFINGVNIHTTPKILRKERKYSDFSAGSGVSLNTINKWNGVILQVGSWMRNIEAIYKLKYNKKET